ncbi:Tannase/feruloyl esterase [Penicillium brevicompactum]
MSTGMAALCASDAFSWPSIPGAQVTALEASYVSNVTKFISEYYYYNHGNVQANEVSFCNVTLSYQHTGKNDSVMVGIYLPSEDWNGRMQGIGGNGYTAGLTSVISVGMIGGVAEGYITVTTNGGHTGTGGFNDDPSESALNSDGSLDYQSIEDLATISLNDASLYAKSLAQSVYGTPPKYSYWTGCSQGGRQGMQLAQKYPDAYDGIVAASPAINWSEMFVSGVWAQFVMNMMNEYPYGCEIDGVVAAAISACDTADGVVDGIVSDPTACDFDPFSAVGTQINCTDTNSTRTISNATAQIVNATWTGPRGSDGQFLWYGYEKGATLTGGTTVVNTECSNSTCIGAPLSMLLDWLQVFVEQDLDFTVANITSHEQFDFLFEKSLQKWGSYLGTNNPDLSEFRDAGGKMLSYHGLMDEVIPTQGSIDYYEKVLSRDANAAEYYRFFEAPMMGHCYGASGGYPSTIFDSMVAWVENGTVPETLPVSYTPKDGKTYDRMLCPYPQTVKYKGTGDHTLVESFYCAE